MSPQLQAAARYVLDQPNDVALLSMREQARRAGVQPYTMTRLAQRLGLVGYDDVRALYGDAVRDGLLGFSGKARTQVAGQTARGDYALAAELVESINQQISRLNDPAALERLVAAATLLGNAARVFCLGLRSCHSVVSQFAYMMSFLGDKAILLDGAAGMGLDPIRSASANDVVLAVSVAPYTRVTIEAARYVHGRGIPIVAVTDSHASPLAALTHTVVLVSANGPSFFHTISPAFVVGEVLAALVAGRGGDESLAAIERAEAQLAAFGIHWSAPQPKKSK